jgi:hypothetical protein
MSASSSSSNANPDLQLRLVMLGLAALAVSTVMVVALPEMHLRSPGFRGLGTASSALAAFIQRPRQEDLSPVYFGRKLEPRGRVVLHGAGQTDDATFREYSARMGPNRPMLYMTYVDLKEDLDGFFKQLHSDIGSYPDYLVPQIGLSLNAGQAATHYEGDVAQGQMDDRVAMLCKGLKSLDRPVYLRIGYEFNGQWNGYDPADYILAFRRIAVALRACAPETATVWNYAPDALGAAYTSDYMRFYPGDDFVDWWAINLFAEDSFDSAGTRHFLDDAVAHRFPVMVAESTPRRHPVTEGAKVVDGWYKPYFELMRRYPQIKAFCYINWDWRKYPQWADWGDARIQNDPRVLAFYRGEVANKLYRSAAGEAATRTLLGLPAR